MAELKSIIFWDMTPCSLLSFTLRSSETSGATRRNTRRHIPEDDTLHDHRCENLKSYNDRIDNSFEWERKVAAIIGTGRHV
jgi:hypothetical protein